MWGDERIHGRQHRCHIRALGTQGSTSSHMVTLDHGSYPSSDLKSHPAEHSLIEPPTASKGKKMIAAPLDQQFDELGI